jgi:uncharacterized protein DUF4177
MTHKWEYKALRLGVANSPDPWDCEKVLQELGNQGWELVIIHPYYGWAYFKRPKSGYVRTG